MKKISSLILIYFIFQSSDSARPSSINQSWFTAKEDKVMLRQNGHAWKQGMWSKEETEQLHENVKDYCKKHGISDPRKIIFGMSKEERSGFYRIVANGINRPLFSVYRRIIR